MEEALVVDFYRFRNVDNVLLPGVDPLLPAAPVLTLHDADEGNRAIPFLLNFPLYAHRKLEPDEADPDFSF